MDLDYDKIMPLVKNVAASVSRLFPSYVQSQDTEGQLLLFMLQQKSTIIKMVDGSPDTWESSLASLLRKRAFEHCNKEKAAAEGYDPSDIYRYSIPKIQTLIVDVFEYVDWQSFGSHGDGQPKSRPQANTTGDRVAELIDIKSALEKLTVDSYNTLVYQYKYQYTMQEIADASGISLEAAKKRAQRALKGLQKHLGYKPTDAKAKGLERRTVRSNAAARADLASNYDG